MLKICQYCKKEFNADCNRRKFCCLECFSKKTKQDFIKNNPYKKRIMKVFQKMKERCYYEKDISFKNYGARGIKICDEWINNKNNFYKWALENGYAVGLSIDRIDTEKDYSPDNCRWATRIEQARNKRNNVFFEYNGKIKCLAEWASDLGITEKLLWQKIHRDKKTLEEIMKKSKKIKNSC